MKYEDVTEDMLGLFEKVKEEYFSELYGATFKLVYRNKRKGKKSKNIVFAEICATSEMVKYLTSSSSSEDGLDYIIIIDKNIFEQLDDIDKIRILRHELRHCDVSFNDKTGDYVYGTQIHSIEDFYEDVEIESKPEGDIRWKPRIAAIAESIYEQLEDDKKTAKKNKNKRNN